METAFLFRLGWSSESLEDARTKGNDRAADRVAGIRYGLQEAGINSADVPCIEVAYQVENGSTAFETLMGLDQRPTAVMCINDVLAVGAVLKAQEIGLSVPQDVSITGFDDIEIASLVAPKLTTVHVPHRQMGSLAASELVDLIENRQTSRTVELESVIKIRDSLSTPATS